MTSSFLRRLIKEPLVHFVLLGAIIFVADYLISSRQDDPKTIVITQEIDKEAKTIFRSAIGREPTAAEVKTLRERWVDNEVLYREGLALRVDQGDSAIRERVIFKSLSIMQANLALPKIDERGLQEWFEKNRQNYDEPPRIDFLEAVLIGDKSPEAVNAFIAALTKGIQTETQSGVRIFKGRPLNSLVTSYGTAFTDALEQVPIGEWRALKSTDEKSKDDLHIVRVEGRQAGVAVTFASVKDKIYQDWKDATLQQLRTDTVRNVGKKYKVVVEESKDEKSGTPAAAKPTEKS